MVLIEQQQIFFCEDKNKMTFVQLIVVKKKEKKSICQHHTDIYLFFVLAIRFLQLMDSKNTSYYFYYFSSFIGNSYGWVCLFSIKANILPSSALEPMCLSQIYCAPGAPEGLKT